MSDDAAPQKHLLVNEENDNGGKITPVLDSNAKIISANSSDASSNGEEYEIVQMMQPGEVKSEIKPAICDPSIPTHSTSPSLNIIGNGNQLELQKTLQECVEDNDSNELANKKDSYVPNVEGPSTNNLSVVNETSLIEDSKEEENYTVFQNVKYLGAAVINDPKNERLINSLMKELNVIDDLCEDDPEEDTDRIPESSDSGVGQEVTIRVPQSADGSVFVRCNNKDGSQLNDEGGVIGDFPIFRIIFFARGNAGTTEDACFAYTVAIPVTPSLKSTGDAVRGDQSKVTFKCHAFRCSASDDVTKVFTAFAQAFKKPRTEGDEIADLEEAFIFEVSLEIRECASSGNPTSSDKNNPSSRAINDNRPFDVVPRQKEIFKLRSNVEKKVVVTVHQVNSQNNSCRLGVERCFGMLVSPGRNVRHVDMQLIEHVTMATTKTSSSGESASNHSNEQGEGVSHIITGSWDPRESAFAVLNKETPGDVPSVYITIAADLVITQVAEPVRFVIETKARIYPQNERYWYFTKKNLVKQYRVRLKKSPNQETTDCKAFELVGIDISEEIHQAGRVAVGRMMPTGLGLQLANFTASTFGSMRSPPSIDVNDSTTTTTSPTLPVPLSTSTNGDDDDSNDAEPMLSGFGEVSKDCSGNELEMWSQVLSEWDRQTASSNSTLSTYSTYSLEPPLLPKNLPNLVRSVGVPEALRGEVWQRMTGASSQQEEIVETYRILITKESPDEKVILRDIHRTFPAHDFFKEAGGVGQESLYRIAKAYSVYDSDIGYCQGQSFLIASLLLQMPEEQAFGVLVKIMHNHGLRDMFRENFEQLQLRLYQLDRLIETTMPDLWDHFSECGLEAHMYASQWFLTVFTAKFPLFLVMRVLDLFLLEGFQAVFQVALAILKVSKRELLEQDFEGLMKYYRVNIPKTYRNEENCRHLMQVATKQIKLKKMKKYEKDWLRIKAEERAKEDPVLRLERENKKLLNDNLRLDTENDSLARELVNSKIEMRKEIDSSEDTRDALEKELEGTKSLLAEAVDERSRLEGETEQLKTLLKREIEKFDADLGTKDNVIAEYKVICSNLSEKLEKTHQKLSTSSQDAISNSQNSHSSEIQSTNDGEGMKATDERIKELELELAKTKLMLVETECQKQDLTHQLIISQPSENQSNATITTENDRRPSLTRGGNKWLSKTLSSIRETAASATAGYPAGTSANSSSSNLVRSATLAPEQAISASNMQIPKSSSVQVLKHAEK